MKKILLVLAIAAAASGVAAQTKQASFDYSYFEVGYTSGSIKVGSAKFDTSGYGIGLSAAITPDLFLTADFANLDTEVGLNEIDTRGFSLGLGGHSSIGPKTDLIGGFSIGRIRASLGSARQDSTNLGIDVGLRHALTEKLELNGGLGLSHLTRDKVQTLGASIGVRYKLAQRISFGVDYSYSSSDDGSGQLLLSSLRVGF
jgi:opacity protein-like surface antigen